MSKLRVNVIGCGAVAQGLYRVPLRKMERSGIASVVSVVDPSMTRAREMSAPFRKAQEFTDLESALDRVPADLSLVLTPAAFHEENSLQALQHGHHVLCEKPMATSGDECRRMVEAADSHNRVLGVGMVRRFFPSLGHVKRMMEEGDVGDLVGFDYREGGKFDWPIATAAAFERRDTGSSGGVLLDLGPHVLDILGWCLGPLTLNSYREDALAGVESNAWLELQASGSEGRTQLSWSYPLPNEFRIVGSEVEIVVRADRYNSLAVKRTDRFEEVTPDVSFPIDLSVDGGKRLTPRFYTEAILCQLVQIARAILLDERPAVSGSECQAHIALIEECYRAAQPVSFDWLPAEESRRAQTLHWRYRS